MFTRTASKALMASIAAGLVTFADVAAAIVGGYPQAPGDEPTIVERDDGSWLIDGTLPLEDMRRLLGRGEFAEDAGEHYHTVAGLAMLVLGRIPRIGDRFDKDGAQFEIVDMDGNRVDRILVHPPRQRVE